jgi:hypothetical protein
MDYLNNISQLVNDTKARLARLSEFSSVSPFLIDEEDARIAVDAISRIDRAITKELARTERVALVSI